jgi:hypothetical protein
MTLLEPDLVGKRRRFRAWIFTAVRSRHRFVWPVFSESTKTAADGINIHEGFSPTRRGSAGCITIAPGYADSVWHALQPGQWYPVHIYR